MGDKSVSNIQSLQSECERFAQRVTQFGRLVDDIGTARDSSSLRTRVKRAKDENEKKQTEIYETLKRVRVASPAGSRGELDKISTAFQAAVRKLDESCAELMRKEKDASPKSDAVLVGETADGVSHAASPLASTGAQGKGKGPAQPQQQQQMVQQQVQFVTLDMNDLTVEEDIQVETNKAIRGVVRDLKEVQECFDDFKVLMDEQGHGIKAIAGNVKEANNAVVEGTTDVRQAREYTTGSRKLLCWLLLVFIIIGGVVCFVLGFTHKKKTIK